MLNLNCKSCDIVTNTKKVRIGDVFFCSKQAEKYLSKDFLHIPSVIIAETGFEERIINNEIISISEFNSLKTIIYEISDIQQELVLQLKQKYHQPEVLIAITGTKGKTSTAWFTMQMLGLCNVKCGYIGTIGVYLFDDGNPRKINKIDTLTTPSIDELYKYIDILTKNDAKVVVFETSSHALHQDRISGLDISCGCFTNLSQDHLDYHRNMEDYFLAKSLLFSKYLRSEGIAVLNGDDDTFVELTEICRKKQIKVFSVGKKENCKCKIKEISQQTNKQSVKIECLNQKYEFSTSILGEFQIYNLVEAMTICAERFRIPYQDICSIISKIKSPVGRMENIENSNIFIDFAHTPKSLEESLKLLKSRYKKVAVLFGCGGNRDKLKRPIMLQVAVKIANFVVITSDNPRFEDPISIIDDITCFIKNDKQNPLITDEFVNQELLKINQTYKNANADFVIIPNREKAISFIIDKFHANNEYAILIAGKGHENYQIIKDKKNHFDDKEQAILCLKRTENIQQI